MTEQMISTLDFKDKVIGKRFVASHAILRLYPDLSVIAEGASSGGKMDPSIFSAEQKREIREFAMSYTENMLVIGNERELWIIVPSVFPASTLCVALKLISKPKEALRALRELGNDDFVFSQSLSFKSARMSPRLNGLYDELLLLRKEICQSFCDIYRLDRCNDRKQTVKMLKEQSFALSYFSGCPTELIINDDEQDCCPKVDFSLFSAFLLSMLISARNNSPMREAKVILTFKGEAVQVEVSFEADYAVCLSDECAAWTEIAADKGMFIHISYFDTKLGALFCPQRDERVYTEIKQRFKMKLR